MGSRFELGWLDRLLLGLVKSYEVICWLAVFVLLLAELCQTPQELQASMNNIIMTSLSLTTKHELKHFRFCCRFKHKTLLWFLGKYLFPSVEITLSSDGRSLEAQAVIMFVFLLFFLGGLKKSWTDSVLVWASLC